MPVLLHLDSSPMGKESVSRHLTREFTRLWQISNPRGEVIYRDLAAMHIPVVDAAWVVANYTPEESRTSEQQRLLALSTELVNELLRADEYVMGVPMHNWGPSSSFKLWSDQIVRFGKTLRLTRSGMEGMLTEKHLTMFVAAGRFYGKGNEDPAHNHLAPWIQTFFNSLGLRDIRISFVHGTAAIRFGKINLADFLAPHIASVRGLFAPLANPCRT